MSVGSRVLASLVACAIVAFALPLVAEDAKIDLPGGGSLVVPVPAGWKQSLEGRRVVTLSLAPATGADFDVKVTPIVSPDGKVGSMSAEQLKGAVENAANNAKSQAVEKSLPIQTLKEGQVEGAYFSATDKAPKPGEFKYLTQGVMLVKGLPVTFTILTNDDSKAAQEAALSMLRAARRK